MQCSDENFISFQWVRSSESTHQLQSHFLDTKWLVNFSIKYDVVTDSELHLIINMADSHQLKVLFDSVNIK